MAIDFEAALRGGERRKYEAKEVDGRFLVVDQNGDIVCEVHQQHMHDRIAGVLNWAVREAVDRLEHQIMLQQGGKVWPADWQPPASD